MNSNTSLRSKVPDAGIGIGTVVLRIVRRTAEGRIFVVRPDEAARSLAPEGESPGPGKVPAQDDWGDGGSGKGATDGVEGGALGGGTGRIGAEGTLEFWGIGLPEGESFDGVLEVAPECTVADGAC